MKYLSILLAAVILSVGANAATKPKSAMSASSGGTAHNSDGCGIGWQYTNKKTLFGTTTRGSTNNNLSSWGMSSGTLGCEKHPFAKGEQEAVNYAATNYENLSIELAQGNGEYVVGMAQAMGCDSAATERFAQIVQSHYGSIVGSTGAELYGNLKAYTQQDPMLMTSCNI